MLDPNDPDVKMINAAAEYTHGGAPGGSLKETGLEGLQPSVEEVPDEHDGIQRRLARQSSIDQSLHPSRASSQPRPPVPHIGRPADEVAPAPVEQEVGNTASLSEPLDSAQDANAPFAPPQNPRQNSLGGGYFPEIPSAPQGDVQQRFEPRVESPDISIPSPSTLAGDPQDMATEYYTSAPSAPALGGHGPASPLSPPFPRSEATNRAPTPQAQAQPPSQPPSYPPTQPPRNQQYPPVQPSAPPPQPYFSTPQPQPPPQRGPETYNTDDEAIMLAQKHARWAISALNFEDVPTAVKELRAALRTLGAE